MGPDISDAGSVDISVSASPKTQIGESTGSMMFIAVGGDLHIIGEGKGDLVIIGEG